MKRYTKCLLALISLLSLASCEQNTSDAINTTPTDSYTPIEVNPTIVSAIDALRDNSYKAVMTEVSTVKHPNDENNIDIGVETKTTLEFKNEDESAVNYFIERQSYDINKTTNEKENINYLDLPGQTYYKDENTGSAYYESMTKSNEFSKTYISDYDEDTGIYEPISYESQFRNPWNFISAEDVTENASGEFILSNQKAQFMLSCYQANSLNWVQEAKLELTNGKITSIVLSTPDQTGLDSSASNYYVRTTQYTLAFSNYGTTTIEHMPEDGYSNDNPKLQAIFDKMKTATSYTYKKTFVDRAPETQNPQVDSSSYTTGYFTQDGVYYAQMYEDKNKDGKNDVERTYGDDKLDNIQSPYKGTDDYDSILKKDSEGKYYAYQYQLNDST